jgi:hypothetical protein
VTGSPLSVCMLMLLVVGVVGGGVVVVVVVVVVVAVVVVVQSTPFARCGDFFQRVRSKLVQNSPLWFIPPHLHVVAISFENSIKTGPKQPLWAILDQFWCLDSTCVCCSYLYGRK